MTYYSILHHNRENFEYPDSQWSQIQSLSSFR